MGKKEKFENNQFNSKSLMEAYNRISQKNVREFGQEFAQEFERDEEDKYLSGALMQTYAQMMDSYRDGTVDHEKGVDTD